MNNVPDLPILGSLPVHFFFDLLACGFFHFLFLLQEPLRKAQIGVAQQFSLFLVYFFIDLVIFVSSQEVRQQLLIKLVVIVNLVVAFLQNIVCSFAKDSVCFSFLSGLLKQFLF